jgi:hypothetical protein
VPAQERGLLRLTLDLTRRRLDLFAEIGAAEVVRGVVAPPTPGIDTWWRAMAAVREAVYALRERGLVQYVKEAEVASWPDLLKKLGGLQLLQRLNPPLPLRSNLKPSLLHVFRYFLNCLRSMGAVLFT